MPPAFDGVMKAAGLEVVEVEFRVNKPELDGMLFVGQNVGHVDGGDG